MEWPTAPAAFFLPMRRASRQNWAARQVSRLWAAAQAHSTRISPSQRLPLVGLPERRLPPVTLLPGQRPAQEARWPAVGNTPMSTPISAMMHSAARLPTPVMVSRWSRARAKGEMTRSTSASKAALDLGGVGLDEPLAVAGQIPQLPDDRGRHEAAAQQSVLQQLAQPRRVADVGLAAGQDLHVPGVDQQQLEPALLQHIPDRLPVLPGRLHHHLGDPLVAEPVAQRRKASAERLVGADLLAAPAADGASGHAGAGDDLVLTHVKPSAALVDHLHYRHLLVVLVRCPAGPTESTMLKVVLAANSSRCREGPRISLNNGLSRTKESRAWPGMPDSHPSRRPSAMRV